MGEIIYYFKCHLFLVYCNNPTENYRFLKHNARTMPLIDVSKH